MAAGDGNVSAGGSQDDEETDRADLLEFSEADCPLHRSTLDPPLLQCFGPPTLGWLVGSMRRRSRV